jgi:phosphoglycolate phosphatase
VRPAFDFDGVIVDSLQANIDAINALAGAYEFLPLTVDGYRGMLTVNFVQYWQMLLGKHAQPFLADLQLQHSRGATLVPGMREVLNDFAPTIISSNHGSVIRDVLSREGIDLPIYGIEYNPSKIKKLQEFRNDPAIFVTDTIGDVYEGRNAGYTVVAVTWGFHTQEMLKSAGPDIIVRTPQELAATLHTFANR